MRVLLDESVPRPLSSLVEGHEVRTVQQMGWGSARNGDLLRIAAAEGFAALVTADRSFEYQQNIPRAGLGLIVLVAPTNKPEDILPLAGSIRDALATLRPGQVVHVGTERDRRRSHEQDTRLGDSPETGVTDGH